MAIIVILVACGSAAAALATTGVDRPTPAEPDADQAHPLRVVSLLPAASALLVELGASESFVGRASDDDTPSLANLPSVGFVIAPDVETLRALAPNLVVVWAGADHGRLTRHLPTGAEVLSLRLDRISDVLRGVRLLAARVHREQAGALLVDELSSALDSIRGTAAACPAPRSVWAVGRTPPIVAGPHTLPDDLMAIAGLHNVFTDTEAAWFRPSLEQLVAREVDVVIWPVGPELPSVDRLPARSPWLRVPAVRRGDVIEVEAGLVHEAGPRIGQAAALLADHVSNRCTRGRG